MTTTFSTMLEAIRRDKAVSQTRLAELTELTREHVNRMCTGKLPPTRNVLAKLSEALALDDEEHDRLALAAGFAPEGDAHLVTDERLVAFLELVEFDLPSGLREAALRRLELLTKEMQRASVRYNAPNLLRQVSTPEQHTESLPENDRQMMVGRLAQVRIEVVEGEDLP